MPLKIQVSFFFAFVSLIVVMVSCNSPYRDMIQALSGKQFCLDIEKTNRENQIEIGKGTLTLNADQTFTILNDSIKFSNLVGNWDLCCRASDYGNYVFKVKGLSDWKQSQPNLFVLVDNKKIRLFFASCNLSH